MTDSRNPTDDEREAVRSALTDELDPEAARAALEGDDRLFVVESYTTDSPGYTGPVAVLLDGDGGAAVYGLHQDPDTARVVEAERLNTDPARRVNAGLE